jgi:hypothetical protein
VGGQGTVDEDDVVTTNLKGKTEGGFRQVEGEL